MSCYHRNLTSVWLQTAMLALVAYWCKQERNAQGQLLDALKPLASNASRRLLDLYATRKEKDGTRYTYNSATPRIYINDMGWETVINNMLDDCSISQYLKYDAH